MQPLLSSWIYFALAARKNKNRRLGRPAPRLRQAAVAKRTTGKQLESDPDQTVIQCLLSFARTNSKLRPLKPTWAWIR